MTITMPAHVTAATLDALTHCLEAYVAKRWASTRWADGIALEGLRLVARHLERRTRRSAAHPAPR
jgi:alcohol dehydrogenase class IV